MFSYYLCITMVLKKKKIVLEENRDDQLYINYMQDVGLPWWRSG